MAVSVSKIRDLFRPRAYDRVPIVLPFAVISIALLVLAWRSYQLSERMERGLDTLAIQYLEYSAEITARRADAAARGEIFRVSEEWQQVERTNSEPDFEALQSWVDQNSWIVSAIYVPDADPISSIFVSEMAAARKPGERLSNEFYTASGSVRYTYDPDQLLRSVSAEFLRQPIAHSAHLYEAMELRNHSTIQLVWSPGATGLVKEKRGPAVVTRLSAPLDKYAIRSAIFTSYIGAGWNNHRVISLWFAAIALMLVTAAGYFAVRGLKREAEATQLRAALIANVSHELRTPLSMIRLGAETLKRSTRLSAKERSDLEESILREVLHLSHLVENVLDVARLQRGTKRVVFSSVDPVQLVQSLLQTYESWITSKGFTVKVDLDLEVEDQMWDREGVSRALINLIDNAIKYSDESHEVVVSLKDLPDAVALAVHDQGLGIEKQDIARIFDPYYRADFSDTETRRGAGLGLTLVQQIVAAHGGRVEVDSTPGAGSTFRLIFPKKARKSEPEWSDEAGLAGSDAFDTGR